MRILNNEEITRVLQCAIPDSFRTPYDEREVLTKAQYQKDIKDFIYWGDTYCALQNKPRRECGHCWQGFKQSVEE